VVCIRGGAWRLAGLDRMGTGVGREGVGGSPGLRERGAMLVSARWARSASASSSGTRRRPDRLVLVGESQLDRTVLVVFTERVASGIIRIISARRATKRERRAYAEGD
jgi:uncharacterized DUF497 family protein